MYHISLVGFRKNRCPYSRAYGTVNDLGFAACNRASLRGDSGGTSGGSHRTVTAVVHRIHRKPEPRLGGKRHSGLVQFNAPVQHWRAWDGLGVDCRSVTGAP